MIYLLFSGADYYPCGGVNDFQAPVAADSLQDAQQLADDLLQPGDDWQQLAVINPDTGGLVPKVERQIVHRFDGAPPRRGPWEAA